MRQLHSAWDLAFHTPALATVDIDFAKEQLDLLLRQVYLHPTGQMTPRGYSTV